ncbi:hypothetical protein KR018_010795 [Drosophila ironensis]|nr:hypothetical protein KR018_010795 [Drosophila ironensis]
MQLLRILEILMVSVMGWLIVTELVVFFKSAMFYDMHEAIFKPYKEQVETYKIGRRSHRWDDNRIAVELQAKVRVHCLVYLDPSDKKSGADKVVHAKDTWGQRCNRFTVAKLWEKSLHRNYQEIYRKFYNELDWLLVVYVDSYVVVETLRYTLAQYLPSQAVYFSAFHAFYAYAHVGQVSSTDYIFSREALAQICTRNCLQDDDVLQGCLGRMEKAPSDRLQPFSVSDLLIPFSQRRSFWIWPCVHRNVYENVSLNLCYFHAALYPYVNVNQMHLIEFMLYYLRPYGVVNGVPKLTSPNSSITIRATYIYTSVARSLYESVRVICLVMSWAKNFSTDMRAVSKTWAPHCNRVIYFGNFSMTDMDIVNLNTTDSYWLLWGKTKAAFRYAYEHYRNEGDWFFKADDDTFAIIENMRYMLKPYSPKSPIYFGCEFKASQTVYMSGGAGYVLSRKAVQIFVEKGIIGRRCYTNNDGSEDFQMGACLKMLKVPAGDSRDHYGRHRFLSLPLGHFLIPGYDADDFWLRKYLNRELPKSGVECCSSYTISMHYITAQDMYFLDTFLFKFRPYGLIYGHPPLGASKF